MSRASEHGAEPEFGQYFVFEAMHRLEIAGGSIVVAVQVQHAVNRVEQQFQARWNCMPLRLPTRLWNGDNHLARCDAAARILVNREGENVGGTMDSHEFCVQVAHSRVVDKGEG